MVDQKKITVVLAAGGTGGHIFPAEALAGELTRRGHKAVLLTDERRGQYNSAGHSLGDVHVIHAKNPSGGVFKKTRAIAGVFIGTGQALRHLRKIRPDVVVGFGGYPSIPTMLAAAVLGIKTILHEQNAVLGRVNRIFASEVDKIATSFEHVSGINKKHLKKIVYTGNPVRPDIKAVREISYPALEDGGHLHILVTGGSQGAALFSEVVPVALASLPAELRIRIRIDQQCRGEDIEKVRAIYDAAGINADLATFFHDISARLASAHLLICRAGASTIAEVTVAGRPAIFVPYIHSYDDHQTENARAIADKSAAFVISQDLMKADLVAEYIKDFLKKPEVLAKTAANALAIGIPDADKLLADLVSA